MTNTSGPLELSDNPSRAQYKPDSAVTDGNAEDDSLQVYGGAKLIEDQPRNRKRGGMDTELLVNNTDSDTDDGRLRHREQGDNSDEGLLSPKKVSIQHNKHLDFIFIYIAFPGFVMVHIKRVAHF